MYYAQLNENNVVIQVIVCDDAHVATLQGTYIKCDIDGISPKNYPGPGYIYRADLGGFVPPCPFASWTLNETTCKYDPPIPKPNDGKFYLWDEANQQWTYLRY